MNITIKNAATAVLVSGLLSASAWAKTPITLTDTNGDGVISAEEIKLAREASRNAAVVAFDTDGDGELSRSERKAMKEARRAEMAATYDSDGDGELSKSERRVAKDARRAAIEQQLDVNGDGEVSAEERAGFEQVQAERREHKHGDKHHGKKRNKGDQQTQQSS